MFVELSKMSHFMYFVEISLDVRCNWLLRSFVSVCLQKVRFTSSLSPDKHGIQLQGLHKFLGCCFVDSWIYHLLGLYHVCENVETVMQHFHITEDIFEPCS